MTAKEYLGQVRWWDLRVNTELKDLEALRRLLGELTAIRYDGIKVQNSVHEPDESILNKLSKIAKLEAQIQDHISRLVDLREEVKETIEKACNPAEEVVLSLRYLSFNSFDEISFEVSLSERQVYRLHSSGLEAVQRVLDGCA